MNKLTLNELVIKYSYFQYFPACSRRADVSGSEHGIGAAASKRNHYDNVFPFAFPNNTSMRGGQ